MRRLALAARSALSAADREARSRQIAARVAALPAFRAAGRVALYAPLGAEVDTADLERLAREAGKTVAWPLLGSGRVMGFASCTRDALVTGPRAALEPPPEADRVAPEDLELVCVPGVAFDTALRRLGRGGGHYDATLPVAWRARRVGLCFEVQVVPAVPAEPHDAPVDLLVTEARVLGPPG